MKKCNKIGVWFQTLSLNTTGITANMRENIITEMMS